MDDELYNILVGPLPKEELMSKALRRQQKLGQIGMATGDRVIAPMAEKMFSDAGSQAWRESQVDMNKRSALARAMESERERKWQEEQNRLARATQREIAGLRAGKGKRFGVRDVERISDTLNQADNLASIVAQFKPEYARTGLPGGRALANTLATKVPGVMSENAVEAQKWWAAWDRIYTLKERNQMFGSALTATEKEAWDKANISPDMNPAQIQENIGTILELRARGIAKLKQRYMKSGFDSDEVEGVFGSEVSDGMQSQKAEAAPEAQEVDLSKLSTEELMRIVNGN